MFHRWLSKPMWLISLPLITLLAVAIACGAAATATPVAAPEATATPVAAPEATATPLPAPTATPQPEAAPEVIKIGMIVDLTGAGAAIGIPMVEVSKMAAAKIKDEGGLLIGGKRYNFEFIPEDAHYDQPERARTAATKLVHRDNVRFIIIGGDPLDSAASTVTEPENVIIIGNSGNAPLYGEKDYMMNCHSTAMFFSESYYSRLIDENPDWNSFVYIQYNARWDQLAVEFAKEAMAKLGKELHIVVADQGLVDYTPTVTAALAKKPDVVLVGLVIGDAVPIIKTIRELGWDGPMISAVNTYHGLGEIMKGLEGVEEYAEDFYQVDYAPFPPNAAGQQFIDEYKSRTGGEFNDFAFASWWLMESFVAALKAADTIDDPDKIMAAYEKVQLKYPFYDGNYVSGSGGKELYGKDRVCETPQALSVIRNGTPVTLDVLVPSVP